MNLPLNETNELFVRIRFEQRSGIHTFPLKSEMNEELARPEYDLHST